MDPQTKNILLQSVQRYFLEFLEKCRLPKPDGSGFEEDHYYIEQAKGMVLEDKRTLYVRINHLETMDKSSISFDPQDFRQVLQEHYYLVRESLNAAVPQLLGKLEDPELQEKVAKMREAEELKFSAAFYGLPEFHGIRHLRTEKLGQLITVCGTVTRTTEVKPELIFGTFQCNECQRIITGIEQQFKVTMPSECPTKSCGNRTNWTLLTESRTTRFGDWQRVRLQENENEVPAGSMPRSMDVIVRDECVERCKPGDKVLITGCVIVVPDVPSLMAPTELKSSVRRSLNSRSEAGEGVRGLKGLGHRDLTYKVAFYGIFVEEDSAWDRQNGGEGNDVRSTDRMYLSQAEKDRFQQIAEHTDTSGKRDCLEMLARSIAPSVHECVEVKKGILLMLIGGVAKTTDEGIKLRGDINVCIVGDPATAKSALLKWTSTFLPRAVFASGKSSTAAGLTASVVKDADLDNEKLIEPGALMLSDSGVCCIDEFEQMDAKDTVAIHEAMEQQTITLSKAGIQASLNARASILAACLPVNGYYQATLPLHKNLKMSAPIMSRFDLMFVLQDIHDETTDKRVSEHVLALHRNKTQALATQVTQLELQRYIRLARTFKPKITKEVQRKLVRCYKKLREDKAHARGGAGVTVRQLESLIRLAEAVARVHLDDEVREEYVKEAYDLQVGGLRKLEHGNIDLNPDVPDDVPAEEGAAGSAMPSAAPGDGPARPPVAQRKRRITFAEYSRIGTMLASYLAKQEESNKEVKEEDLIAWYIEQIEREITTEDQLLENSYLVQLVINRLVDRDRVILVYRQSEDPRHPERRILVKNPNFPVGDVIAEVR